MTLKINIFSCVVKILIVCLLCKTGYPSDVIAIKQVQIDKEWLQKNIKVSVTFCQVSFSLFVLNLYLENRSFKTELAKLILLFNSINLSVVNMMRQKANSIMRGPPSEQLNGKLAEFIFIILNLLFFHLNTSPVSEGSRMTY